MMLSPHIHVPYEKISEHLRLITDMRLNLEIYFNSQSVMSASPDDLKRLKDLLSHNPALSFHAPFMDLSPGAIDPDIRQITLDRFHQVLDAAEILQPSCIVFHSGYEKWKYALSIEPWLTNSLPVWHEINSRALETGAKIAIENIFEDEPSNLKALVEEMGSVNFGICFDTGHFNLFSSCSIEHWMDEIGSRIIELHVHDNDKSSDQHLPIGDGTFDFERFFSLMKSDGLIHTIEAHTPEHVIKGIERLSRFAG
ncbi:MAG: sugar phosphate isomerase/epimerase [Nitrospiraceae bacterium]|nr:sugar phosphate isomerase/epimerase [Nitrospiraceae bacterium]